MGIGVFLVIVYSACFTLSRGVKGEEKTYKPVRVPMIPGMRVIYQAVLSNLVRSSLDEAGGDKIFAVDLASESFGGASNIATCLGNGSLSVCISPWAELVVFRWPNPTYSDQLRYFTKANSIFGSGPVRMGDDAPSPDWKRYGHPIEPCLDLGSRGGLLLGSGDVVWIGDPSWTTEREFVPDDSTVLVTRLTRPEVEVEVTDWVDPGKDFMVRSFKIKGEARRFFYHSTFAPRPDYLGQYTKSDPAPYRNMAYYLEEEHLIIHCQSLPSNQMKPEINSTTIAWGFFDDDFGFQVGADRCQRQVPANAPLGGRDDAGDGRLSGNSLYIGPVDAALSKDLDPARENTVTVIITAAVSAREAVDIIQEARATLGVDEHRERANEWWQRVSGRIHVPEPADPVTARVIRRSVLNLIQGQDQESGAIVASLARQPHYHFDWPRDGAFFDLTLDLAGFQEAATNHHSFYARTQYTKPVEFALIWIMNFRSPWYKPAGHWPSNMAADGSHGSIPKILPFEIDETGLLVWDFWRHERVLAERERPAYILVMKETLARAADALLDYVDLKKGWTRPAVEDDNFLPDATLHGAASVLTGLAAACDAGPRWGIAPEKTEKWCEAARALRDGVRGRIMDPRTLERAGWRGLPWTLWPAPVFDDYSEPGAMAIKERLAQNIQEKADKERPGFAYLGEEVFILALADQERGEYRELLESALLLLTHEVAFPGTDCYGEVTLWGDFAGTGEIVAQQRTAIPHLWNGATVYLSVLAIYEPWRFAKMRPPPASLPRSPKDRSASLKSSFSK